MNRKQSKKLKSITKYALEVCCDDTLRLNQNIGGKCPSCNMNLLVPQGMFIGAYSKCEKCGAIFSIKKVIENSYRRNKND